MAGDVDAADTECGPSKVYTQNSRVTQQSHSEIQNHGNCKQHGTEACTAMSKATLFATAKWRKQPERLLMGERTNRMWSGHTVDYYSASKRKEILSRTTTWMKRDDTRLREINQMQKDKYCRIPLIGGPRRAKFMETGSRTVAAKG